MFAVRKCRLHVSTVSPRHLKYRGVLRAASWSNLLQEWRSFSTSASSEKCYKVAIVGTGPAGCYTAKYLLSTLNKKEDKTACTIDMLERLPTPYGLVRYGVAPDHPEVKNVENDFAALFENQEIRLFGNVNVGDDNCVSVEELREIYDAVVLAYGCESDRKLGLPGEENLSGILSAREFVAWYNGHPYFEHIGEQVTKALDSGSSSKEVVVIGQGNVALDCARILAKGAKGLNDTDIASRALPVIGEDGVPLVTVVGRRGHIQGAFTIKELRELTKLEEEGYDAKFIVREDELELGSTAASLEELSKPGGRPKVRIDKLLRETASRAAQRGDSKPESKEIRIRFLMRPQQFEPSESNPSFVGSLVCERTQLEGEPGKQVAVGTGAVETIPANLVLVSIGYKGVALPGMQQWFDEQRGVVKNMGGKVDSANATQGGLYVSGWLKRGPSGIIGTNIMDAKDTVINLVKDLENSESAGSQKAKASESLLNLLEQRGVPVVKWTDYLKIDHEEKSSARKRSDGQPREKITGIQELLTTALASS